MSADTPKYRVSWDQIVLAVTYLTAKFREYGYQPRKILAVARGGVIPATMLSHKLGVREVGFIRADSYTSQVVASGLKNVVVTDTLDIYKHTILPETIAGKDLRNMWDSASTLVVDDLWDTGHTISWIRQLLPEATTTTAFHRKQSDECHRIVSFPGLCLDTRDWIEFPWER